VKSTNAPLEDFLHSRESTRRPTDKRRRGWFVKCDQKTSFR
jgi:hypothetical protein